MSVDASLIFTERGWVDPCLYFGQREPLLTGKLWKPFMEVIGSSKHIYEKILDSCKSAASFLMLSLFSWKRCLTDLLFSFISLPRLSLSFCLKKSYFFTTVCIIFQVSISFHGLQTIFFFRLAG